MSLLQGRQEGQMGFLVSVLAPSEEKGLGDSEGSDRQGPLLLGIFHTHPMEELPEEPWCSGQPPRDWVWYLAGTVVQWSKIWLSVRQTVSSTLSLLSYGPLSMPLSLSGTSVNEDTSVK